MSNSGANGHTDSVNDPIHPFGLPPGSVRGLFSLLICSFFWILLLWPGEAIISPMLGHFFLLALVLMAFASQQRSDNQRAALLPWLMKFLFVVGSLGVVAFVIVKFPERLQSRLTPNAAEFAAWWGPMLATMAGGFAAGLSLRFFLGTKNIVFLTLRAWLSIVGMTTLSLEIALYIIFLSSNNRQDWLAYFQVVELAVISAYFGTRA